MSVWKDDLCTSGQKETKCRRVGFTGSGVRLADSSQLIDLKQQLGSKVIIPGPNLI